MDHWLANSMGSGQNGLRPQVREGKPNLKKGNVRHPVTDTSYV
jgi:hypothetical protein